MFFEYGMSCENISLDQCSADHFFGAILLSFQNALPRDSYEIWTRWLVERAVFCRSLLEVSFEGEVGTGTDPTLDFYSAVSHEL